MHRPLLTQMRSQHLRRAPRLSQNTTPNGRRALNKMAKRGAEEPLDIGAESPASKKARIQDTLEDELPPPPPTGSGSSYMTAGQMPATGSSGMDGPPVGRTRHKRSGTQTQGMAKATVNGVRDWASETGELLGLWKGEKTRPL